MSRQGIDLDSSTLADWVGRTAVQTTSGLPCLDCRPEAHNQGFHGRDPCAYNTLQKGRRCRNHGRVPQPELKLTFAETVEGNVLAQRPITIEIIVSATKCPEDIVANAFELLSSGDLEANPVAA